MYAEKQIDYLVFLGFQMRMALGRLRGTSGMFRTEILLGPSGVIIWNGFLRCKWVSFTIIRRLKNADLYEIKSVLKALAGS